MCKLRSRGGTFACEADSSALVAEIDEAKDSTIDYAEIRADPLPEIRH